MTHKWNYEDPTNLWEQWPWWLRWPAAVAAILWLVSALALPFFVVFR